MRKPFDTLLVDDEVLHNGEELGLLVLRFPVGDRVIYQFEDKYYLPCLDEDVIEEPHPDYPNLKKWYYKCWVSDEFDPLAKHARENQYKQND